jgi:hypothetical protein
LPYIWLLLIFAMHWMIPTICFPRIHVLLSNFIPCVPSGCCLQCVKLSPAVTCHLPAETAWLTTMC